mgnify:CR=1 FL=1|jgi:uncharacterized protein
MKIKSILLSLLLVISVNTTYADFNDGYNAYEKGDYKTAFNEWKPLAMQGDEVAQYNLALMHANGEGVLKDYKEAVKWYRKAAEQGYSKAQFNLAFLYDDGKGVLKDDKEAVKWYRKAAKQGYADAQHNLALMYVNGEGTLKDLSKAKYWIKKAYENPDAETSTVELAKENWNTFELWKYDVIKDDQPSFSDWLPSFD